MLVEGHDILQRLCLVRLSLLQSSGLSIKKIRKNNVNKSKIHKSKYATDKTGKYNPSPKKITILDKLGKLYKKSGRCFLSFDIRSLVDSD